MSNAANSRATSSSIEPALIPLERYDTPALPTEEWLRQKWAYLRALVAHRGHRPFIADDKLERATLTMLDKVVAPPACGPVIADLSATIAIRAAADLPSERMMLVVVPPCDENDVVGTWAAQDGHRILRPPATEELLGHPAIPSIEGDGLLVIPRLDRWYLRHGDGLGMVRALLDALDASDRRCVVGCSSWGWAFLCHAVQADLILPQPLTFRPFDSARLQDWFADLANADDGRVTFRFAASGGALLDGRSADQDAFFDKLAALSRGIPWVAWHLWRQALRSNDDADVPTADDHARQETLWVAALDELVLPGHHPQVALLVLHALLIHGSLTRAGIDLVVPIDGRRAILSSLIHSGFVNDEGGDLRIRTAAYPSVRSGLESAGFPVATL